MIKQLSHDSRTIWIFFPRSGSENKETKILLHDEKHNIQYT